MICSACCCTTTLPSKVMCRICQFDGQKRVVVACIAAQQDRLPRVDQKLELRQEPGVVMKQAVGASARSADVAMIVDHHERILIFERGSRAWTRCRSRRSSRASSTTSMLDARRTLSVDMRRLRSMLGAGEYGRRPVASRADQFTGWSRQEATPAGQHRPKRSRPSKMRHAVRPRFMQLRPPASWTRPTSLRSGRAAAARLGGALLTRGRIVCGRPLRRFPAPACEASLESFHQIDDIALPRWRLRGLDRLAGGFAFHECLNAISYSSLNFDGSNLPSFVSRICSASSDHVTRQVRGRRMSSKYSERPLFRKGNAASCPAFPCRGLDGDNVLAAGDDDAGERDTSLSLPWRRG